MPSEFGGGYNDLMEHWRNDLKDLAKVVNFTNIQELLDR
ncbi:hypothetical protein AO366_1579 [Moraxella catarrhalis]|uniref:Uncharacterized protein n=1 Tax=Moraxella catarrhalis TaxID=480 RepID=A0AB36DQM2_MORCA|nr:hypothetical protein AO376_0417 [Moraxella catarrhalis]OAV19657.1 hypothetical protein AO374_0626 [Moraxella catarrhalis]OAV22665.1 hypothetical protein AO371_1791 [Moraxella catarrhalis]OAV26996.1 hypothetical protein AO370_0450 [Moraxella catarrhalis]OAV30694.1 hypothetical protein AO368_0777 [Moraxella catarrhalis]